MVTEKFIKQVEKKYEEAYQEYDSIYKEWDKIKNTRKQELQEQREAIRDKKDEQWRKVRELEISLRRLESQREIEIEKRTSIIWLSLSGIFLIAGVILLMREGYLNGYWKFVEEHNLVEWVKGNGGLMIEDFYDKLYWLSTGGISSLIASIVSFIGYGIWKADR